MDLSIWLDVILPLYLRHIELIAQTLIWWDAPAMAFQQLGWCSVPIWVVTSPVLKFWILVRGSKVFKPTGPFSRESTARLRPLVSQAAPLLRGPSEKSAEATVWLECIRDTEAGAMKARTFRSISASQGVTVDTVFIQPSARDAGCMIRLIPHCIEVQENWGVHSWLAAKVTNKGKGCHQGNLYSLYSLVMRT